MRKRYRWQTNCMIPAQDYYDKLWSLRRYFYSIDEQKKFIEISNQHDHLTEAALNQAHDDFHADGFHVHMDG